MNMNPPGPPQMTTFVAEKEFWDSGAFSLNANIARWRKQNPGQDRWAYYDGAEFWHYMECYVAFVKEKKLKLYANVDAIHHPELSLRNQQWLEDRGLHPVPIVHYGTDLEWLTYYIKEGYEIIGLGGLPPNLGTMVMWLDQCFNLICNNPQRLPYVKLHGFGFTVYEHLFRYPWWSVDSVTYMKAAAYGSFLMPWSGRNGSWDLKRPPFRVSISYESLQKYQADQRPPKRIRPFTGLSPAEQARVLEWLEEIEVPLGSGVRQLSDGRWTVRPETAERGNIESIREVAGISTEPYWRRRANLLLFDKVTQIIPPWPWPFGMRRTFGL